MRIYCYDATLECLQNAECRWKLHEYRGKVKLSFDMLILSK